MSNSFISAFGSSGGGGSDATKLPLAGGTLTGQLIQSTAGAASTPPMKLTGAFFTGGSATTTKPQFLIEPTGTTSTGWSTSGTGLGVNAASGFVGKLADFQLNGATKLSIDYQGSILVANGGGLASAGTSLPLGTQNFSGGAFITLFNIDVGFGSARTEFYDCNAYLSGGYQIQFANTRAGTADCGLKWGAAGTVKVTNATTGYAAIDASAFKVSGTAGASFGPGLPTSITVVNGIITAIS
jgi:hypothetical protein